MMLNIAPGSIITFTYKNYKGKISERLAAFRSLQYGESEYHEGKQMFLGCFCMDRKSYRSFAICDITNLKVLA